MDSPNSLKSWDLISENDFPVESIEKSGHPELTEQYSEKWNKFVEKRNKIKDEYFNEWKKQVDNEEISVEQIFLELPEDNDEKDKELIIEEITQTEKSIEDKELIIEEITQTQKSIEDKESETYNEKNYQAETNDNNDVILIIRDEITDAHINKRKIKHKNTQKKKKRKKNPKQFKHYSSCNRKKGKDIFMMIKMDQWSQVHPDILDNEKEIRDMRQIFKYIWNEMDITEKYAYMQYSKIDEKYQIAFENSVLNSISSTLWEFWNDISTFFTELVCTREKSNKLN